MIYVPFLAEKKIKQICSKGTINVLQGGGVSGVWSKTIFLHIFWGGPLPN